MTKFLSIALLMWLATLAGCTSTATVAAKKVGKEPQVVKHKKSESKEVSAFDDIAEKSEDFEMRETTYRDVVRALGKPTRISTFKDGRWVDYEIEQGEKKGKTLHMRFDQYDVLYLKSFN